ncbi:hypothetical protein AB1N83_013200 [Pleurotus pulmonarius]
MAPCSLGSTPINLLSAQRTYNERCRPDSDIFIDGQLLSTPSHVPNRWPLPGFMSGALEAIVLAFQADSLRGPSLIPIFCLNTETQINQHSLRGLLSRTSNKPLLTIRERIRDRWPYPQASLGDLQFSYWKGGLTISNQNYHSSDQVRRVALSAPAWNPADLRKRVIAGYSGEPSSVWSRG